MSTTTLVKQAGIGNFEWLRLDQRADYTVGDAERLADYCKENSLTLVIPAEAVSFKQTAFEEHERKLLRQTLPFSLEDDLVEDVDDLHFALGETVDNTVSVAITARDNLETWRALFAEEELAVEAIVSELQLLPWQENSWCLYIDGDRWLLRFSEVEGFAMEKNIAKLAMQLLLDESENLPEQLMVYAKDQDQTTITAQLPEMLKGIVEWKEQDYWQMLLAGYQQPDTHKINLLQGEFALGLPWKKWWKHWRLAAVVLASAVVLNLLFSVITLQVLDNRNLALRTEIEQEYRSVVPRGAVMDPVRQLRGRIGDMQGGSGPAFVNLFAGIAKALVQVEGLTIQNINYTERQSELRLTIIANSFDDVETARSNIEKLGLTAELTGTNADGDKTRARLRVRG